MHRCRCFSDFDLRKSPGRCNLEQGRGLVPFGGTQTRHRLLLASSVFPLCEWLSFPVLSRSQQLASICPIPGPHRLRLALRLARQGDILDRALPLSVANISYSLYVIHPIAGYVTMWPSTAGRLPYLASFCDCAGIRHRHRLCNACLCSKRRRSRLASAHQNIIRLARAAGAACCRSARSAGLISSSAGTLAILRAGRQYSDRLIVNVKTP